MASKLEYLTPHEREEVARAHTFAAHFHEGQLRQSGEPYIIHPEAVAEILADLEMDAVTLQAAFLHDVVEDTSASLEEIGRTFGPEVAQLVDGVTKLSLLEDRSQLEQEAENLRKMFLAMAQDVRVILIKLADRLHNLRTLKHLPPLRQRRIAQETLEIYAPLAHRLGIYRLKWELEDLSLRYLEPDVYQNLSELIRQRRNDRETYIEAVAAELREKLLEHGVDAEVSGRPKSFYSIYQKMRQGKDFSEIYDLVALRIIVDSVKDCYGVLGIVHTLFTPIPGRFKDYIAMPKPNLYQSLHTTVVGPGGQPVEVQIRTREMHRTAEFGIAAHWIYKEGHSDPRFDQKLGWLRQLLEWQGETRDAREFLESLKIDLFADEVFVFTPKGQVHDLPAGATPVDFAYRIHTDVGHRCVGARVNGRIVPLDHRLQNGDIVEILTNKGSSGPSLDWLQFVQTSTARSRIRTWFKQKNREENAKLGRDMVEREARRVNLSPDDILRPEWLEDMSRRLHYGSIDDLFAAVGYGGLNSQQVVSRLRDRLPEPAREIPESDARAFSDYGKPTNGVRVRGADNLLVRFSRCCTPVPGDPIIGYVSRGKGVTVHRLECPNAKALMQEGDRIVEVAWDQGLQQNYPVEIEVHALDRSGLLADVAQAVAETRLNILSARARGYRNRTALVQVVMEIHHLGELRGIIERLRHLPDVYSVERVARQKAN